MINIKRGIFMIMGPVNIAESYWMKAIKDELTAKKMKFMMIKDDEIIDTYNDDTTVITDLSFHYNKQLFRFVTFMKVRK